VNKQLTLDIKLRDDATFANYVGVAAKSVLEAGPWAYVYGQPGSGRTHLLQSCCHHYVGSIYLAGLGNLSPEVLDGLASLEVICIDDIEDILGDVDWEEAIFHLMNAVKDQGKRIFIAGPKRASGLKVKLPDLHSRLVAAMPIETDELNDEEKLSVLMQRAHGQGFYLGRDVGRFILSRSGRDMGQLLDLVHKLEIETLCQGKRVTIPFVKQTLSL